MYPFLECRRVLGHFEECCKNYKWLDHDVRCTVNNNDDDNDDDSDSLIKFTNGRVIQGPDFQTTSIVIN